LRPYPLIVDIENRSVFVIGGGRVALRKVEGLLESGAQVIVVSPELDKGLESLADDGLIQWIDESFNESVLDTRPEAALVFGATDQRDVNLRIHAAAVKRKIPCNIADVPDLCTFIVPAVVSRGDLVISISTGGSSPALARRIREDLENQYGPEYAEMTNILAELRKQVLSAGTSSEQNKELFTRIVNSDLLSALETNDRERALEILTDILPNGIDAEQAMKAANTEAD
jgi:precorrin-2 dehydrogenase/sirohydrochlorin ferrochelatase